MSDDAQPLAPMKTGLRQPARGRRERAGRIVSWGLGLSLAGAAAAGPALAEAQVQSRLRER
jgi:hypothetical protein